MNQIHYFDQGQTYTLDGTDVYRASKQGPYWWLFDVNHSFASRHTGIYYGRVDGYLIEPGRPVKYFRFTIDITAQFFWIVEPEAADLKISDFQPCSYEVKQVKLL